MPTETHKEYQDRHKRRGHFRGSLGEAGIAFAEAFLRADYGNKEKLVELVIQAGREYLENVLEHEPIQMREYDHYVRKAVTGAITTPPISGQLGDINPDLYPKLRARIAMERMVDRAAEADKSRDTDHPDDKED